MWSHIGTVIYFLLLTFGFLYFLIIVSIVIVRVIVEPVNAMCKCTTRLDGKIVLVTGGNSGIGFQTALHMANRGARVIIADVNNSDESVKNIIEYTGNENVEYRHLNLADFNNVRAFAENINKTVDHLNILVNNAGCLTFINDTIKTKDGVEMTMQVNYLAPFLLTSLLLEKLRKSQSRIVIVTSGMYYKGEVALEDLCGIKTKNGFKSYLNSKYCTVLWTKALSKKLPQNVSVRLHPGMVFSDISSWLKNLSGFFLKKMFGWLIKTPFQGAQTTIHVCLAPGIENMSGSYFSNCKLSPMVKIKNEQNLVEDLWNETTLLLEKLTT